MRTVAWKVAITAQPETRVYLVWSCSSAAASRKALLHYIKHERDGRELRLGQGAITIIVMRSHLQEVKKWEAEGNRLIR